MISILHSHVWLYPVESSSPGASSGGALARYAENGKHSYIDPENWH